MAYKHIPLYPSERRTLDQLINDLRDIADHPYSYNSDFIRETTTKAARRLRTLQREVRKP